MENGMAKKRVQFQEMLRSVHRSIEEVPEHRKGRNVQYEIADAGLAAFSVFFMQSPSFLAYQRHMEEQRAQNNARSLFGVEAIPSDGQIRSLLDPVEPRYLRAPFWAVYELLQMRGHLEAYESIGGTLLCSLDGTRYFSSQRIKCANCTVHVHDEQEHYSHMVLAAVLVAPGKAHVIALDPEFIMPQDGHDKQDCEQQAIKRWVKRNAERFGPWEMTILTDDLHSHQPLCELLREHKLHFIMTCKTDSHKALYEEVELLTRVEGAVQTMTTRHWNGRYHERREYRWVEQVPIKAIKGGAKVLRVNWCEITILREDTGKQMYHNAWITSHELTRENVPELVAAGRAHWKVENENFNVLKNRGYNLEHNYGHGQQHLSTVLLSLLLLAFLFHTALHLSCAKYQAIRQKLGPRRTFFNDLRALTRYLYFPSWEDLLIFMCRQLELSPG
jgi:hypothetical protein